MTRPIPSSVSETPDDFDGGESVLPVSDQKSDKLTSCKSPSMPPCTLNADHITSSDQGMVKVQLHPDNEYISVKIIIHSLINILVFWSFQ